jgi:hypothetical protein
MVCCRPTSLPTVEPSSACAGTFLRGVLDKVGVEPELVRIGGTLRRLSCPRLYDFKAACAVQPHVQHNVQR